jgi:ankyrin repeat protein
LNDVDSIGQLPLHYAVCSAHAVALVRELLSSGSAVDAARTADHFTPLHLAAAFGRADVCRALVAAGADANAVDAKGNTPERLAASHGFNQLADWLSRWAQLSLVGFKEQGRCNTL